MIQGGCFCGKIRYEIEEEKYECLDCHCTMCRRAHSAPYVTWMVVPKEKHRYTGEAPKTLESSKHGARYFCSSCGTHVACDNTGLPEIIDIPVGSLDQPDNFQPTSEVFRGTRLPWIVLASGRDHR